MKISKHLLVILITFAIALLVALVIKYADVFEHIWLWLVGLIGGIAELTRRLWTQINSLFAVSTDKTLANSGNTGIKEMSETKSYPQPVSSRQIIADQKTTQLKVLRYIDDGETTLGLLYVDSDFYSYTLEDTYRKVKIPGKTRIPAGTYHVDFLKELTPLTITYRKTRDWFDYHLEIKNVPGFTGVYIHNGGTSADTEGCLLIADGITANDAGKMLTNSRQTFEAFYKMIGSRLKNNFSITITILDENWIDHLKQ